MLDEGAVGADEEDEERLAAKLIEADVLAGDNVGEGEVGAVVPSSSMVDLESAMGVLRFYYR